MILVDPAGWRRTSLADVQRVTAALQSAIRDGAYPPGRLVPGKSAFARQYGVGTADMHKALHVLRARGYLRRDAALGCWYVADQMPPERAAPDAETAA